MLKAYGFTMSGNCWKVRQVLELTKTPFHWIEVNSNAGETRTPAYLAKNPNGKVPMVELDDGQIITESNANLCHFAENTALLPPPGLARTRVLEWLFFEQYSHEPTIAVARNWISYRKIRAEKLSQLKTIWEDGYKALSVMERRLSAHSWLVGDGMTVADLALFAYTQSAEEGEFDLGPYPGIEAWRRRIIASPGIRPLAKAPSG
jgi:glutathione S-transferase